MCVCTRNARLRPPESITTDWHLSAFRPTFCLIDILNQPITNRATFPIFYWLNSHRPAPWISQSQSLSFYTFIFGSGRLYGAPQWVHMEVISTLVLSLQSSCSVFAVLYFLFFSVQDVMWNTLGCVDILHHVSYWFAGNRRVSHSQVSNAFSVACSVSTNAAHIRCDMWPLFL